MTFQLTFEQANNIRHWRIDENCSWGRISELTWQYFPELRPKIQRIGTVTGKRLCDSAMEYFGEKIEDDWN